jgi:CRP/FNR family transcriptional regulator, cyclic AMP receptor protein
MDADVLRQLEEAGSETEIPAGQVLIERGQHGAGLFVIADGTVAVETIDGEVELGPGSVVGERAIFSTGGRRAARVRAVSDLRVFAVGRDDVERLCAADEEFARRLADATA